MLCLVRAARERPHRMAGMMITHVYMCYGYVNVDFVHWHMCISGFLGLIK